jgi:hypothetical protein
MVRKGNTANKKKNKKQRLKRKIDRHGDTNKMSMKQRMRHLRNQIHTPPGNSSSSQRNSRRSSHNWHQEQFYKVNIDPPYTPTEQIRSFAVMWVARAFAP